MGMKRQTIFCIKKIGVILIIAIPFAFILSSSAVWANFDNDLIEATKRGDMDAVRTALNNGANIETRDSIDKVTALMLAAFHGHNEIVKLLVQSGADVNARSDKDGWVPLMHAAFSQQSSIVESLLQSGANIDATDNDGDTALMQASFNGPIDIVKLLLKYGGDMTLQDVNGKTALDFAQLKGDTDIIALIEAYIEHHSNQQASLAQDRNLIEKIQRALQYLGYEVGGIDGKLGTKTIEAINTFQAEYGLDVTGKPTPALFTIISAYLPKTATPVPEQKPSPSTPKFSCQKKYCKDISTCEEAYYLLKTCGYGELDRDHDGVPCENICPGG